MHRLRMLPLFAAALLAIPAFAPAQTAPAQTAPAQTPPPANAPAAPKPEPFTPELKQRVLDAMGQIITTRAFVPGADFSKWNEFVAKNREAIDKAKTEDEFAQAINGTLRNFGFSHIVLATPRAAQARISRQTVGIGVNIQPNPEGLLIIRVVPGAPAEQAGIVAGDTIVEANGKKISGPTDLQGEEGKRVRVKVKRADGSFKEFNITRRRFSTVRPEELVWVNSDTALVRIPTFDLGYNRDRVEGLMKEAGKAKNLIVDLRLNGGGAVVNMLHFLGLVTPPGTDAGAFITRQVVDRYVKETNGSATDLVGIAKWTNQRIRSTRGRIEPFKGNVAVLVNGGTGSAAEITAATLREQLGAPVIGTRSAGAVLASIMAPLPGGWNLQFPLTDYVTAKGLRLEGNGVKPDIEQAGTGMPVPGQPDRAIEYALAAIGRFFPASSGR